MAEKKIVELNQTADRIKQLLDNVHTAISVEDDAGNITGNEGKYWVTGKSEDGEDVILTKRLSDDNDYKTLETKIQDYMQTKF